MPQRTGNPINRSGLNDLLVSAKAERIQGTLDGELWSSPLAFLLRLTVATLEWALRKRWQLK